MVPDFGSDVEPLASSVLAGKYRIVRPIGKGGMGAVYLGNHILMGRTVGIKVVHSRWAQSDPASLQRFRTEACASSRLNHPNVMTVFDFGVAENGTAYLVMDYIPGRGLDEIMRECKPLSVDRVIDIFSQACDGLEHAHEQGVVHRDLKPSNIMIVDDGNGREIVKIVDFGIAKLLPGRAGAVESVDEDGVILGSPLYMSPEQCLGKPQDGRSDVYALGCLMYEALTGQAPIRDQNVLGIIYRHINETPKRFLSVAPELNIAPQIEAVILRALQKDPNHRQQSMKQLKSELQIALKTAHEKLHELAIAPVPELPAPRKPSPFDAAQFNDDATERRLLQELESARGLSPEAIPNSVLALEHLAQFYIARNSKERAESCLSSVVEQLVEHWGPWDIRASEAVKRLADFYRDHGAYHQAEPLYLDLLTVKRKALGSAHPDIACILLRLADVYLSTSHFQHAQKYYEQCLLVTERVFGQSDPVLTPVLNGLATVLRMQNEMARSEELYLRALAIKEEQFGPNHYEVAANLICLGVLYRQSERFREAERTFGRALTIYEQSVGTYHPDVSTTLLLLAEMYSAQNMRTEAEEIFRRVLKLRMAQPGAELKLAEVYETIAIHHIRCDRLSQAEESYRLALKIREKKLGSEDPQVAAGLTFLATLFHAQSRFDDAEPLYIKAIDIFSKATNCSEMLSECCRSLGDLYTEQERYAEAEPIYLRALERAGSQEAGKPNQHARAIVSSLANLYRAANGTTNTFTNLPKRIQQNA